MKLLRFFPAQLRFFSSKEFESGHKASLTRQITRDDVQQFAHLTGDDNPIHLRVDNPIVHGAFLNGLVSAVLGHHYPGPGTMVVQQSMTFPNPCYVNDTVHVEIELIDVRKLASVRFSAKVGNKVVLEGTGKLLLPREPPNQQ